MRSDADIQRVESCPFSGDCLNKGWRCRFCKVPIDDRGIVFQGFKDREYYQKVLPLIPDLKSLFDDPKNVGG